MKKKKNMLANTYNTHTLVKKKKTYTEYIHGCIYICTSESVSLFKHSQLSQNCQKKLYKPQRRNSVHVFEEKKNQKRFLILQNKSEEKNK